MAAAAVFRPYTFYYRQGCPVARRFLGIASFYAELAARIEFVVVAAEAADLTPKPSDLPVLVDELGDSWCRERALSWLQRKIETPPAVATSRTAPSSRMDDDYYCHDGGYLDNYHPIGATASSDLVPRDANGSLDTRSLDDIVQACIRQRRSTLRMANT